MSAKVLLLSLLSSSDLPHHQPQTPLRKGREGIAQHSHVGLSFSSQGRPGFRLTQLLLPAAPAGELGKLTFLCLSFLICK